MLKERDLRRREIFYVETEPRGKKRGGKEEKKGRKNFHCQFWICRPSPVASLLYPYGGLYRGYQNMFLFCFNKKKF